MCLLRDSKLRSAVQLALNAEIPSSLLCEHHLSWQCPHRDALWVMALTNSGDLMYSQPFKSKSYLQAREDSLAIYGCKN